MNETKPVSIKEASKMMQVHEQFVRLSIRAGEIPGAFYIEGKGGKRGKYYVTNTQIENMMKGGRG